MPRKYKKYLFVFLIDADNSGIITAYRVITDKRGEELEQHEQEMIEKIEERFRRYIKPFRVHAIHCSMKEFYAAVAGAVWDIWDGEVLDVQNRIFPGFLGEIYEFPWRFYEKRKPSRSKRKGRKCVGLDEVEECDLDDEDDELDGEEQEGNESE